MVQHMNKETKGLKRLDVKTLDFLLPGKELATLLAKIPANWERCFLFHRIK